MLLLLGRWDRCGGDTPPYDTTKGALQGREASPEGGTYLPHPTAPSDPDVPSPRSRPHLGPHPPSNFLLHRDQPRAPADPPKP